MRLVAYIMLTAVFPATAFGQSGISADLLDFSPAAGGLMTVRSPELVPDRLEIMLGSDWSYRLMGLEQPDDQTLWTVEQRVSLRVAVAYTPTGSLRLAAGFTGAPLQEGLRSNQVGALTPMRAAMGTSWFSAVWAIPGISGAIATTLLLPTAPASGLTGAQRMDVRVEALLSGRLWLFRPVVNLGVATRPRTSYFDLVRDDGLTFRLGCETGPDGWPVVPTLELAGETPLGSLFSKHTLLEGLIGLRIPAVAGIEFQIGAGIGILGAGAPAVRGVVLARWLGNVEKRDGLPE